MTTTDLTTDTVLVTGATGRSGRRIAARLLARGLRVRLASRSGQVPFDWHDDRTWAAALNGCAAAYLCYSPDLALPGADTAVGGFAETATALGVRRLVLLSGRGEDGARRCEDLVLAASIQSTVVRCAWFQENFSEHFLRESVLTGRIAVPAGSVREPFVSLDDIADVAALALAGHAGLAGRVLELTGPESLGFDRAARSLSAALGSEVRYEDVSPEVFVAELVRAGVDRADAQGLAWLFGEVLDGRNEAVTDTIELVLGRPATGFDEFARRAAGAGVWSLATTAS